MRVRFFELDGGEGLASGDASAVVTSGVVAEVVEGACEAVVVV